jgi:hypothetical protein
MRRYLPAVTVTLCVLMVVSAAANSYNTPGINGHVTTNEGDWETDERAGRDARDDCRYYPDHGDIISLWVTWDEEQLYFGLTTTNGPATDPGNGYVVYIDTDAQGGITGATDFTSADFYPRRVTFSTMGVDAIFGVWNLDLASHGVRHCKNPSSTTPIDGTFTQINPGWRHIECAIPWDGLYGLGAGVVPSGTKLRFVAAIVGPDNTGAYDALPTTTLGLESAPSTPQGAYTDLDLFIEIPVDADGDGVPDPNYPPGGSISGTVALGDTTDLETVVTVTAYQGGEAVWSDDTPAGGGEYRIERLADGDYDVTAEAFSYLPVTAEGVTVADTADTPGIDFVLTRVTGQIDGEVALSGGPADLDVTVGVYDPVTLEPGGSGEVVVAGGSGAFSISTVADGDWLVLATAKGYAETDTVVAVVDGGTTDAGLLTLPVVTATKYGFVDSLGNNIYGTGTTVSLPDSSIYYYAEAWIQPRDDSNRIAYWDEAAQADIVLSAKKLDPSYDTLGDIIFWQEEGQELVLNTLTSDMFDDGSARFLVSGDSVEVVRVLAEKGEIRGVLEVGIDPPAPVRLALSADLSTISAGDGVARITGQLVDASGNDTQVPGVVANMTVVGVGGGFSVPAPETESNGRFEVDFSGTAAGTAYVSATIDPTSPYTTLDVDTLAIELTPGEAALVTMSSDPGGLRPSESATLTAQVVDSWGNHVSQSGLSVSLSAEPASLVASLDSPITTGSTGAATGVFVAGSAYGTVEISGSAGDITVETLYLPIDATIAATDEAAPETDDAHNSDAGVDLTILRVTNDSDDLIVGLDFASNWDGVHLAVAIETNNDAAGGTSDPFGFPINYAHPVLPDYTLTYKYSANDYGDLRRNLGTGVGWEHYDFLVGEWRQGWAEGVNVVEQGFVTKGAEAVELRVPMSVIGAAQGDTVRLQVYLMQETDGEKRAALDSVPHDDTHDMLPDEGDWWETATTPVTLSNYATYVVREEGFAPILSDGAAAPSTAAPGELVTYSVRVSDGGGGIGDVFVDLTDIGGSSFERMADDGAGHDAAAGDGVYTASDEMPASASDGPHTVTVTARDEENVATATLDITVTADNPATAIREFEDPEGDDHGPNQIDAEGLYYEYPTNLVFRPGSFDITRVEIFADGDRIVFRTHIDDLVYHQDASAADWGAPQPSEQTCDNPNRTDLNLQKVDIYIDAIEGVGATSGFPSRYVDIANVDAWDYGISAEGWGKWFVTSNGSNSSASWGLYKNDSDISMCDDHEEDYIDVSVYRGLLGLDEDNIDNNEPILSWDIIVCLSSHDGESNDQNLGGVRWVNATTSEWQIGGGRDGEGGRDRDANIIDVAVSPGRGHEPGRPQEEMLDYTTADAEARFDNNQVACVLEASFAVDASPPIIHEFPGDPELEFIPWVALDGAPAVLWTTITDVTGVGTARMHWYPVGLPAERDSVDMVNLAGDIWAADISREDIVAGTNIVELNKIGEARVLEGWIRATDSTEAGNAIKSPKLTFGLPEPWSPSQTMLGSDVAPEGGVYLMVFQDGTVLEVEDADLVAGETDSIEVTLTPVRESLVDVSNLRDDMEFVGVAREIEAGYQNGTPLMMSGYPSLTLHYPQYDVGGLDESSFGLFGWVPESERWILKGGAASPRGNTVTGEIPDVGTYGVFYWGALDVGSAEGLSGVMVEPNPFSPNGDGLYDDTMVSFFLGREADYVNVEFYDLAGRLVRRLVFQGATDYSGRTPAAVVWDGADKEGNVVPYGIYVMRVEAKFKTEPTFERVNRPVVVIK